MRLSDIKGERTMEVLAAVIDPLANIAASQEAKDFLRREKLPEGTSAKEFVMGRVRTALPILLNKHKKDILAIMAAIEGVSYEEYAGQLDMIKLLNDAVELLNDEAFLKLFFSAQNTGTPCGSAPVSTEDTVQ
jgi:hypothetical protein